MKQYYTVGEFSRLFGINTQTLYYYDQIGLLKPNRRDPNNGRRYYAFDQVYRLASIRFMRKIDCSIEQIQDFLGETDYHNSLESLKQHSSQMRKRWQELLLIDSIIQRKVQFVEERLKTVHENEVTIQTFPDRRYFLLGSEERLYFHDSFYHYPTIAFYQNGIKSFGAYLDGPFSGDETISGLVDPSEVRTIPAGQYLCAYHVGPYEKVAEREAEIRSQWAHLPLSDQVINFNIIDQFVDSDQNHYITEMQIPILTEPKPEETER